MRRRRAPVDRKLDLRARRRVGSNPDMVSPIGASHRHTPINADCPPSGRAGHNNRRILQYGGIAAEYNGRLALALAGEAVGREPVSAQIPC